MHALSNLTMGHEVVAATAGASESSVCHQTKHLMLVPDAYNSSEPLSGANAALASSSFSRRTSAAIAASRSKPSFTCWARLELVAKDASSCDFRLNQPQRTSQHTDSRQRREVCQCCNRECALQMPSRRALALLGSNCSVTHLVRSDSMPLSFLFTPLTCSDITWSTDLTSPAPALSSASWSALFSGVEPPMDERNAAASVRPAPPALALLSPPELLAPPTAVALTGDPCGEVAPAEEDGRGDAGGSDVAVSGAEVAVSASASAPPLDAALLVAAPALASKGEPFRAAPGDQSNVLSSFAICRSRCIGALVARVAFQGFRPSTGTAWRGVPPPLDAPG